MPRRPRIASGGIAYHVLNRAVGRMTLFEKAGDFAAFERVIAEVHQRVPMRILSYCLMSNHWHLVLWPKRDGELSEFMRLLSVTHVQRWHAAHGTSGTGPLYQGRFKSFPIEQDDHLLAACRYVERNPVRASIVPAAQDWQWGSAAKRKIDEPPPWLLAQAAWPVDVRADWLSWVNRPQSTREEEQIVTSIRRGRPFGSDKWVTQTAARLRLQPTLRPRGRPKGEEE